MTLARSATSPAARPSGTPALPTTSSSTGAVITDSRECGPGSLYVARVGELADGHDFVARRRRGRARSPP